MDDMVAVAVAVASWEMIASMGCVKKTYATGLRPTFRATQPQPIDEKLVLLQNEAVFVRIELYVEIAKERHAKEPVQAVTRRRF